MNTEFELVENDRQIAQTASLARQIWSEHYGPMIGMDQVDYMVDNFQSEKAIASQIKSDGFLYYLIVNKQEPIGYFAVVCKSGELFLSKLYICKAMRGRGLARQAIEHIKSIAAENKLDKITLTVNKNNRNSIAAYEKLGFANVGSVVQDIGGGFVMDDYKMELFLW